MHAYQSALARLPGADRIGQARLHRKAAIVLREQRLYRETLAACCRAETALGEKPGEDADAWWDEWLEVQVERTWVHYWLAQWPEMEELVLKAGPTMQERGGPVNRMRFLWASCMMRLRKDRYTISDEMLVEAREGLAASREWGSPRARVEWQFEIGFLLLWRRELDEAKQHLEAALELTGTFGMLPMRTLSLTYLTVLHRLRGQADEVLSYARRAQEAAEAAQMPDYVAAAKGNQAWLAWRRQDLPTAEQRGQEALDLWRQSSLVYPFQWQALWPLIAVALAQGRGDDACGHAQALLDPAQQRLPDDLAAALRAAVEAKADDQAGAACPHLDQALALARDMGYV
jgi:tetratricopeptide (TPR) repeat protein